ncbi:MAG: glycosyltransferase family 2 protein [Ferruginibacter sp.]
METGKKTILNNGIKNRISFTNSILLQLSIIIVNFNVKFFLEQCLSSVMKACANLETEIIVVDNNSTDGSKDFFDGRFSKVRFIWGRENSGFSKANNLALKQTVGEYILFLNPDTILPEDCLEKCMAFFQSQKTIGAMGIRMIDGSGHFLKESKRAFPSPLTSLFKLSGLSALFPASKIFARYYLGHLDQNKSHEVDILAGAFMMINRKVLDKTGGFDERFFMYGEDVDLSYRIQKAGFKNIYFSESTIVHFKGESTKRGSLNYVRLFYGAMSLFVKKHYGGRIGHFYNLLIQAAIWIRGFLFSGIGHWLNRLLNKRKEVINWERCFIIADKKEFVFITSILQKNNKHHGIVGRINPHQSIGKEDAGNIQQLSLLIDRQHVKEIILCTNGFSAKEMIALIQELPPGLNFRFHFAGTLSIVGSNRKESAGEYIAIDNPDL